jgi:hypothetical protein
MIEITPTSPSEVRIKADEIGFDEIVSVDTAIAQLKQLSQMSPVRVYLEEPNRHRVAGYTMPYTLWSEAEDMAGLVLGQEIAQAKKQGYIEIGQ